ncbi:wall-associated receptor kinase 3-like [Setaria italica]|uniref:wall-associated receptor kinase 3-like n=1 Tax=Setaria italica TaxID=4555 RepID=UPI00064696A4|nr:wall-associated receptor kinase 3-like [Setaria italica]
MEKGKKTERAKLDYNQISRLAGNYLSGAYLFHQKRSLAAVKKRYFKQHGGLLLLEEMKSKQGISFTLFTKAELEEATDNFNERNVLGKGGNGTRGNGTVYRGTLKDNRSAAIKKCKMISERQEKEFGKEMLILSQINHRNVVKFYGCCLEVEVPMLVYEFIPNGTLYQLIHGRHHHGPRVSFATRLKIAHEAAEALAYLHSWASPPIIHGDVKSANILIDDNYTVRVSDFGASTLAPTDEAQFVTFVQGTYGYLDPEYMQTSKLTSKSDVYSFGVVILELLTCRKATNLQAIDEEINLSAHFLLAMSENRLGEILDEQIKGEESIELIEQVAELARRCLEIASEQRPPMREVADELERFRNLSQHPWGQETSDEGAMLVGSPNACFEIELSNGYVSMTDSAYLGIQSPR